MEDKKRNNGHRHHGKSSERLIEKEKIVANLSIRPGQKVLDAGCGNGYMSVEFSNLVGRAGKVYALDPDATAIARLTEETRETVIEPFVGDITRQTKLPPCSIDLIYLSTVLHGFAPAQMRGFVDEVKRLLKQEGILAIVEIKKEETPFGPPQNMRFSPEELKNILGLSPVKLFDIGPYFYLQTFQLP